MVTEVEVLLSPLDPFLLLDRRVVQAFLELPEPNIQTKGDSNRIDQDHDQRIGTEHFVFCRLAARARSEVSKEKSPPS